LNLTDRSFHQLAQPLLHQVAPLLFNAAEWSCCHLLGGSECLMRLYPLALGLFSLPLFWAFARDLIGRRPALLGLASLSVSSWGVGMSALLKPYSGDLFWSLALLVPCAKLLKNASSAEPVIASPHRGAKSWWWTTLVVVTPFAIFGSFPAV